MTIADLRRPNRRHVAALLPVSLLLVACEIPTDLPPPPQTDQPGTISGQLLVALPGSSELVPAAGAKVQILSSTLATTSDSDGRFLLKSVTQKTGDLLIQADPDAAGTYQRQRLFDLAAIGAGPGQQVSLGNVELDENAVVSGKVFLSDQLTATSGLGGTTVFVPEGPFTTYTSDDGSFILDNLPVGTITLTFFRTGYQAQVVGGINLSAGQELQLKNTILDPQPVSAATTGTVTGQLIFVPPVSNAAMTAGVVLGADEMMPVTVSANGTFSVVLPVGIYTLEFEYPGYAVVTIPNVPALAGTTSSVPLIVMTPAPPGMDAGGPLPATDAGQDAGPGDGGTDGGVPNSGQPDASQPALDAGQAVDAGQPIDAGQPVDAGAPMDAGQAVDAGQPIDAGPPAPPVAKIVTDGVTGTGDRTPLDGSSSQAPGEPAGLFLSYAWTQTSGTSVISTFTANDSMVAAKPFFTAPSATGELGFTLTVTDTRTGLTAQDSVTVTVIAAPQAAVTPRVLQAAPGAIVTFDGAGSVDPLGLALSWQWSSTDLDPGPSTGETVTFTAPETPGTYSVSLVVSDLYAVSAPATAMLEVLATDGGVIPAGDAGPLDAGTGLQSPVADIVTVGVVGTNASLVLDGTSSQAPGEPAGLYLTYAWTQTSGIDVLSSFTENDSVIAGRPTFTAPAVAGNLGFTLTVTDMRTGLTGQATVTIVVIPAPVAAIAPSDQQAEPGATVTFDSAGSYDPNGYNLTWQWSSADLDLGSATTDSSVTFLAPAAPGTYSVSLVASDLFASSPSATAQLVVMPADAGSAADGGSSADAGTSPDAGEGADGGTGADAGPGSDAGVIFFPPVAHVVTTGVVATKASLTLDGTQSQASGAQPGLYLSYQWTQTSGPTVTLSSNNSVLAGMTSFLAPATAAVLGFNLTVTDTRSGLTAATNVTIQVLDPPVAVISPSTLQVQPGATATFSGAYSFDPNGLALSYQWSSPTLSLGPATGSTISFTAPQGAGTYSIELTVKNAFVSSTTTLARLTVAVSGTTPAVNAGANQIVAEGTTVQLQATSPTATAFYWVQTSGTPVTLSDPASASPTFTAPAVNDVLTFEVTATTPQGPAQASTNVEVELTAPLVTTPAALTVQTGATVQLVAIGTSANPITYSWTQISGSPNVTLTNASSSTATFVAPADYARLGFQVTATTSAGSATATTYVTVQDTSVPQIVQSDPASDGDAAGPWLMATATFSKPLAPTSVTPQTAFITDGTGAMVSSNVEYIATTQTVRVVPLVPLIPGAAYALTIGAVTDQDPTPNVHPTQTLHWTARPITWTTWSDPHVQTTEPAPGVVANDSSLLLVMNENAGPTCTGYQAVFLTPGANGVLADSSGCGPGANYGAEPVKRGIRAEGGLFATGDVPHWGTSGYFMWQDASGLHSFGGQETNGPPGNFFSDGSQFYMMTSNGSAQFYTCNLPWGGGSWVSCQTVEGNQNYSYGGAFAGAANAPNVFVAGARSNGILVGYQLVAGAWKNIPGPMSDGSIAHFNNTSPYTGLPRGTWAAGGPFFAWSTSASPDQINGAFLNTSGASAVWETLPNTLNDLGTAARFDIEGRGNVVLYAYVQESSGLLYLRQLDLTNPSTPVITDIPGPAGASALNINPACTAGHPEISSTDGAIWITWSESCTSGAYTVQLRELQ